MSTITLQATAVCEGGDHADVNVSLNGVLRAVVQISQSDITRAPTDEEIAAAVVVMIRAYKIGRTMGQLRNALVAGLDVVL